MLGHLLALGIRIGVQQDRVRESQRRIDPGGYAMRRMVAIRRHKYKVNGPLAAKKTKRSAATVVPSTSSRSLVTSQPRASTGHHFGHTPHCGLITLGVLPCRS